MNTHFYLILLLFFLSSRTTHFERAQSAQFTRLTYKKVLNTFRPNDFRPVNQNRAFRRRYNRVSLKLTQQKFYSIQ